MNYNFIICALLDIKSALVFKKYSLLTFSFFLSIPQVFGYNTFKSFLIQKINNEEVVLMTILWILYALAICCISLLDIASGLLKSKIKRIPFSSQKFIVGLFKLVIYQSLMAFILLFQFSAHIAGWSLIVNIFMGLMFLFGVLIVLWEFRSVGDNMEAIFNKPMRMFHVLDIIIETIETKLINKIKDSKICQDENKNT